MKIKQLLLSLILVLFCIVPVFSYYDLGTPQGHVNDYTNTLTANQKSILESKLTISEKESSNEIAVVIIDSVKEDYIENFAVKLFEAWKIGKKNENNGVLILIAISDRDMKIEVGYGLEGSLTDVQSSWIINNIMKPRFREDRYYEGIDESVDKIIDITKGEFEVPSNVGRTPRSSSTAFVVIILIIQIILVIAILRLILSKSKGRKNNSGSSNSSTSWGGWSSGSNSGGGGSGGGFGGFSGGRSGGGGASGSW